VLPGNDTFNLVENLKFLGKGGFSKIRGAISAMRGQSISPPPLPDPLEPECGNKK
jgi:hypothetical protein